CPLAVRRPPAPRCTCSRIFSANSVMSFAGTRCFGSHVRNLQQDGGMRSSTPRHDSSQTCQRRDVLNDDQGLLKVMIRWSGEHGYGWRSLQDGRSSGW
ncbi:hypothetical protein AMELA_G00192830, partial [Ameiurus melas]